MQSALPYYKTESKDISQLQTVWRSILEPFLRKQQNQSIILKNISLISGTTTVKTGLDRPLEGWKIVRQRASASIYDNQDANADPASSLILISSAAVVVDIEVF
jgi:hypothetical protein